MTSLLDIYEQILNESLMCEDRESKNMHRARKWIEQNHPEVLGRKLEDGQTITSQKLTEEIRNTIPNVRMCDCKFLVGVTRLYFENQNNGEIQSMFNRLNKMLKIICTAHAEEYDNDLNGMSFEDLDKKFSGAVRKELDNDKEEIGKLALMKKEGYQIVPIDSFEQSKKYGKYTTWCVTHYENMYDQYTKGGLGRFYFCLKSGFENTPKEKGEGCPMDDYGKSMIAISVNDDGSLNTCTCRWNHDNGGDDNMMDTKEISEFFGLNFYETFKPYPVEQLLGKYEKLKDGEDEISRTLEAIKIEDKDGGRSYVKVENDRIIKMTGISDICVLKNGRFYYIKDGKIFDHIEKYEGDFDCSYNNLTSLEGCPKEVGGSFICYDNKLTSLKGCPQKVGGNFWCDNNQLTSLEGCPEKVEGDFYCSYNNLTSLEGCPREVGGDFDCFNNKLTSREKPKCNIGGEIIF